MAAKAQWKEKRIKAGYEEVSTWIEPTAAKALARLRAAHSDVSLASLMGRIILAAEPVLLGEQAQANTEQEPNIDQAQLADLKARVESLERCRWAGNLDEFVYALESQVNWLSDKFKALEQAKPVQTSGSSGKRSRKDIPAIVEHMAHAVVAAGSWETVSLGREGTKLREQGVDVWGYTNFAVQVAKFRKEIEARAAELRAKATAADGPPW